jgi:hypothetical protein
MARRADIAGSLRAVSCSNPDEADPLRSEKPRACDRPQPDKADPLRSEKRRACDRP